LKSLQRVFGLLPRVLGGVTLLTTGILLMLWFWRHPLGPRGGLPFPSELVVDVPQFFQADPRWGDDFLGKTPGTLGGEGCAVTSAAMVLKFYGVSLDPGRLNRFLTLREGYEGSGWIRWEVAALFSPGIVEKAYEDLPSYGRIDWNLLKRNPVIIRLRLPDGITHFVVIVGKRGLDYLIRDPSGRGGGRVYPLSDLGVPIEALRYYRKLR
jgi:hypothetical protein